MKKKHLRLGKSTISILLSVIMVLSTVFTGSSVTIDTQDSAAQAEVQTSTAAVETETSKASVDEEKASGAEKKIKASGAIIETQASGIDSGLSIDIKGAGVANVDGTTNLGWDYTHLLTYNSTYDHYYTKVYMTKNTQFGIDVGSSFYVSSNGSGYGAYANIKFPIVAKSDSYASYSNMVFKSESGVYGVYVTYEKNKYRLRFFYLGDNASNQTFGIGSSSFYTNEDKTTSSKWTKDGSFKFETVSDEDCKVDAYIEQNATFKLIYYNNVSNSLAYLGSWNNGNGATKDIYANASGSTSYNYTFDSDGAGDAIFKSGSGYYTIHFNPKNYNLWITPQTSYAITTNKTGSGTVSVDSTAYRHKVVTVTSTPTNSEYAATVTVNKTGDANTTVTSTTTESGGVYTTTFEMPAYAVTVNVTFEEPEKYDLTLSKSGSGTVTGIPYVSQTEGTAITVTSTPSDSSQIAVVDVYKTGDSTTKVTATTKKRSGSYITTFTMPAYDVTVSVSFTDATTYTVTSSSSNTDYGTVSASSTTVNAGQAVYLTATLKNSIDASFTTWTVTSGTYTLADGYRLTDTTICFTPTSDVTIQATFTGNTYSGDTKSYWVWYGTSDDYTGWTQKQQIRYQNGTGNYVILNNTFTTNNDYYFALSNSGSSCNPVNGNANLELVKEGEGINKYQTQSRNSHQYVYCTFSQQLSKVMIVVGSDFAGTYYKFITGISATSTTTPTKGEGEVKVVAKDGTARSGGYEKFVQMADTTILSADGDSVYTWRDYSDRATSAYIAQDAEVVVQTTILGTGTMPVKTNATTVAQKVQYRELYYVKAFVANGVTYPATETSEGSGVYSATIQLPNDGKDMEITPVYFYKKFNENFDILRFEVEGFGDGAKDEWLGTVACYVYYVNNTGAYDINAFDDPLKPTMGGFPGQPMVEENGKYVIEFPRYDHTGSNLVCGMTLNNYIWDDVHGDVLGVSSDRKGANHQTYDYDDFGVLAQDENVDTIYFRFKYRTAVYQNDNTKDKGSTSGGYQPGSSGANYTSITANEDYANGWEVYKDHDNNVIDLFNNRLTLGDNPTYIHVVADGYRDTYIGRYATEWSVYGTNGMFITKIAPSCLFYDYTKDGSGFKYDSTTQKWSAPDAMPSDFPHGSSSNYWSNYKTLFSQVYGLPAQITFESAVYAPGAGNQPAERCDGRWFASRSTDQIHSTIRIEYSDDNGNTWTQDTLTSVSENTYVGGTTKANVAFTTDGITSSVNSDIASTDPYVRDATGATKFNYTAESMGDILTDNYVYQFDGFWRLIDGHYSKLDSTTVSGIENGSVDKISGYDIVARYKRVANSTLTISHNLLSDAPESSPVDNNDNAIPVGNGKGTTTVTATILKDDGSAVGSDFLFPSTYGDSTTDEIQIDSNTLLGIKNWYSGYKIQITLTTTPNNSNHTFTGLYDRYDDTANSNGVKYYPSSDNTTPIIANGSTTAASSAGAPTTVTYTVPVSSLFNDGATTLKCYDYKLYSNLTFAKNIALEFKFYDRDDVSNSAATIKQGATTLTYSLTGVTNYADLRNRIAGIVSDRTQLAEGQVYAGDIGNLLDNYVIWPSQITAETQFATYPYYTTDGTTISQTTYGALSEFNSRKSYHTTWYSGLGSKGDENWVTYYNGSTPVSTENAEGENDNVDPDSITKVVVWAFNRPNRYTVTAYTPKKANEKELDKFDETKMTSITEATDGLYYFGSATVQYEAFYNQRIGISDTEGNYTGLSNGSAGYLNSYFGQSGSTTAAAYTGEVLDAPATATVSEENYVFDGWYTDTVDGSYVKVSSDRVYGNRITSKMNLYAMYRLKSATVEATNGIGVGCSTTKNGQGDGQGCDIYFTESNGTKTKKIRFNTQLNVYYDGSTIDSDPKIQEVAVVYVNANSNQIQNSKTGTLTADAKADIFDTWLNANDTENGGNSAVLEKGSTNRKIGTHQFTNPSANDYVIVESYVTGTDITLSSKNRVQFVLPMAESTKTSYYDNLIGLVAIKYNGKWIVSDNYISFIPD